MAIVSRATRFAGTRRVGGAASGRSTSAGKLVRTTRGRAVRCTASLSRKQGLWLKGDVKVPEYLDGSLDGDFGFDPLGLGADEGRRAWYVEAEKTHCRWAMAGVAGILFTELVGIEGRWYEQGAKDYAISPLSLLAIQLTTLGWMELNRLRKFNENETLFDPLNKNSDIMALREIKNGRLAMIAFVGFAVQALVTKMGPLESLAAHVADPLNNNILTNIPNVGYSL